MSQRANPTLIGAFLLGATALIIAGVFLFAGGSLFQQRQQYVMFFEGSVYGLQVGAPVVFRGVRIGSVKSINLRFDEKDRSFLIPVVVETEEGNDLDNNGDSQLRNALPDSGELIARGLRARLATQSLLTGQLYIELDFYPDKAAVFRSSPVDNREIPTVPSPVQELTSKLEAVDFERLMNNLYSISSTLNDFIAGPELQRSLKNIDTTLSNLSSLTAKLDANIDPVAKQARESLDETAAAMRSMQDAMKSFEQTNESLRAMANPDSPTFVALRKTAEELSRTATALRMLASEESPSMVNVNRGMKEMSAAARALRELAESIERHPESLLKGRNNEKTGR